MKRMNGNRNPREVLIFSTLSIPRYKSHRLDHHLSPTICVCVCGSRKELDEFKRIHFHHQTRFLFLLTSISLLKGKIRLFFWLFLHDFSSYG